MRNRMLVLVSVGAGIFTAVTFLAAPRAEALPQAVGYGIPSEVHDGDVRRNVAYVCRRDAYGRTCTYVWRPDRSHQPHTYWSNVSPYQSRGSGYYPYGSGYYPWYWGNPQSND